MTADTHPEPAIDPPVEFVPSARRPEGDDRFGPPPMPPSGADAPAIDVDVGRRVGGVRRCEGGVSALDKLTHRELLDAIVWALADARTVLCATMRLVLAGQGDVRARDDESALAGAVILAAACASLGAEFRLADHERERLVRAALRLGAYERDILKAAAEIAEASC